MGTPPQQYVLAQFEADCELQPLSGGQGFAWRAGSLVLKPAVSEVEARWVAELLTSLDCTAHGFRVQRPVRSRNDDWVVGGWTAWEWLPGEHDLTTRWIEVLELCQTFHRALPMRPRPSFLDQRTDPWSVGDRTAWGDIPLEITNPLFGEPVRRLISGLRPVGLADQVVHGDFPGNVLFAAGQPPAVIDFTPYFRPAAFAAAVVVVDAIAWYGAQEDFQHPARDLPEYDQMVARAAVYRLVTADRMSHFRPSSFAAEQLTAHLPVLSFLGA